MYLWDAEQFNMQSEIAGQVSKIKESGILKRIWHKAKKDLKKIFKNQFGKKSWKMLVPINKIMFYEAKIN